MIVDVGAMRLSLFIFISFFSCVFGDSQKTKSLSLNQSLSQKIRIETVKNLSTGFNNKEFVSTVCHKNKMRTLRSYTLYFHKNHRIKVRMHIEFSTDSCKEFEDYFVDNCPIQRGDYNGCCLCTQVR